MAGRCLFLDMNSFYASVEQQERAELRGKPVIVIPLKTDSTCAIAASYEAKALGIKVGTSVRTAERACPGIEVIAARPALYLEYHRGILETLDRHFVNLKVLSVDEMACWVGRMDASAEGEVRLAERVKQDIYARVGSEMRCSVGIAENVFLAKVASDRQKPNGLTVYRKEELPQALFGLDLIQLPGIGARMLTRLERHGITTVEALCHATEIELRRAWGGVTGARWHYMLRGSQEADYGMTIREVRKSVSHSHVLPPEFRTLAGVKEILMRLFSKCVKRLRAYGQAASTVEIGVKYRENVLYSSYRWKRRSGDHLHANDEITWGKVVRKLVEAVPEGKRSYHPVWAGVVFSGLIACRDMNLNLFDDPMVRTHLSNTVDALNAAHGYVVDVASVYWLHEQAPNRIPFGQPQ